MLIKRRFFILPWILTFCIAFTSSAQAMRCADLLQSEKVILRTKTVANATAKVAQYVATGALNVISPVPLQTPFESKIPGLKERFVTKLSRYGKNVFNSVVSLNLAVMAVLTGYVNSHTQAADQFFRPQIVERVKQNQINTKRVDVLLEMTSVWGPVAFPHISLKIDGRVYSYGVSHMTAESASSHLVSLKSSSVHSLQYVSLHIPADKVLLMQRELESNMGKKYANVTYVNDCSTMISNILNQYGGYNISSFVDASPSGLFSYLMGLKLSGSDKVGEFGTIYVNENKSKFGQSAQNAYINTLDGKLWFVSLPTNMILKSYFENKISKDRVQYHEKETLEAFDEYKVEILKELESSLEMMYLRTQMQSGLAKDLKLKTIEESFITLEEPVIQIVQNKESEGYDLIRAKLTIEVLSELKKQIAREVNGK